VGEGESDLARRKLGTIGPFELSSSKSCSSDDLDGTGTATMTPSHFVVQLRNGTSKFQIAVLAVHVVGSRPRVIPEPDSIVLNSARVFLNNFHAVEDLASCLLHLTELTHEIPKLRLGCDGVGGEDDHAVRLRVGVFVGASLSADYLVLPHFSCCSHSVY